jgi:hypothetical protein
MRQPKDDLSSSLVAFEQDSSLCAVIELSLDKWLVGTMVPGLPRDPLKALPSDPDGLLGIPHRWRDEAVKAERTIKRIVVALSLAPPALRCRLPHACKDDVSANQNFSPDIRNPIQGFKN